MADHRISKLEKLLVSALDKRPDEFGLYPDRDGWYRVKDVFFALKDEEGVGIITPDSLSFNINHFLRDKFEVEGNRLRIKPEFRTGFIEEESCVYPPPVLYLYIKEKNIEHVSTQGLTPNSDGQPWLLTEDKDRAFRFSRRFGCSVILAEINAEDAFNEGVEFNRFGSLYLVKSLSSRFINLPQLNKKTHQQEKHLKPKPPVKQPEPKTVQKKVEYGSFFPTIEHTPFIDQEEVSLKKDRRGKDSEPSWKKLRRERKRR